MIKDYFDEHNAHMERAKEQNFKPMKFSQFVSLVKHIEALNSRDISA